VKGFLNGFLSHLLRSYPFSLSHKLLKKDVPRLTASMLLLIKFIFLGFVQGFTEPIPISSSGHLVILRDFFAIDTPGLSFEIVVHFGSLLAIILVYKSDITVLLKESFLYVIKKQQMYKNSFRFLIYLLIATGITGIIGLTLEDYISEALAKPIYVGIAFFVTSFFLWLIRHLEGHKTGNDITVKIAILIGLAQSLALLPGISRSGATLVAAILLGLNRETALRFSFLLFIPISIGINLLSFNDIATTIQNNDEFIPFLLAFITAMITTYYALKWFIRVMLRGKLIIFSIYCLVLGSVVIISQMI
jgi:undecaprenyl-diphosphatase